MNSYYSGKVYWNYAVFNSLDKLKCIKIFVKKHKNLDGIFSLFSEHSLAICLYAFKYGGYNNCPCT